MGRPTSQIARGPLTAEFVNVVGNIIGIHVARALYERHSPLRGERELLEDDARGLLPLKPTSQPEYHCVGKPAVYGEEDFTWFFEASYCHQQISLAPSEVIHTRSI